MSLNLPSAGPISTRSIDMLTGSDALVADPVSSTGQLAALGPVTSDLDAAASADTTSGAETSPTDLPVVSDAALAANAAVLEFHAALEATADQTAVLVSPVHALTNLGETVGLGYIGQTKGGDTNLLTDVANLPQAIADGGGVSSITPVLSDVGEVAGAGSTLATAAAGVVAPGAGLIGSGGLLTPLVDGTNETVLSLDHAGSATPGASGPLDAVTALGEAAGLGHVGSGSNLLTDAVDLPANTLAGNGPAALEGILTDGAHLVGPAAGILGSVETEAGPSGGIVGSGGLLSPATGFLNAVALDADAAAGQVGHQVPILDQPVQAVTHLGEMAGLGHLGEAGPSGATNLLTDVVDAPGNVLAGHTTGALSQILSDAGPVAAATDQVLGSAVGVADGAGALGGSTGLVPELVSSATHALDAGQLGSGQSSGTGAQPLVTASAGSAGSPQVAGLNLLSPADTAPTHAADVHVGTAPDGQPPLLAATALASDAIAVPTFGSSGADSLVGALADTAPANAPVAAAHDALPVADLGALASVALDGHALGAHATDPAHAPALHGLI